MKLICLLLIGFLYSGLLIAQTTDEKFRSLGRFSVKEWGDPLVSYALSEDGTLTLLGVDHFQVQNIKTGQVLEEKKHGLKDLSPDSPGVSPDLRKVAIISREYTDRDAQGKKVKKYVPGSLWNVATGEKLAGFENLSKPVEAVIWSKNGDILVTASTRVFGLDKGYRYTYDIEGGEVLYNAAGETEISFFAGVSGKLLSTISVSNLTWRYLSPDGTRLYTASGPKRNFIGFHYASEKVETIDVWNTATGKIEKSFVIGDDARFSRARKLQVSPDGQYLALVQKSRKTDADDRLLIFRLDGAAVPDKIIKANPKIDNSYLSYTPDGKYVALDSGKDMQLYSLATGAKIWEASNVNPPPIWLDDNRITLQLLYKEKTYKYEGINLSDGTTIYSVPAVYETRQVTLSSSSTDANGNTTYDTASEVVDYTQIVPNLNNKWFIASSSKYVRIYDATRGTLVQTLVEPEQITTRQRKFLGISTSYIDDGPRKVIDTQWSETGRYIVIRDYNGASISIWEAI